MSILDYINSVILNEEVLTKLNFRESIEDKTTDEIKACLRRTAVTITCPTNSIALISTRKIFRKAHT